jgi:hypothetical protein
VERELGMRMMDRGLGIVCDKGGRSRENYQSRLRICIGANVE